MRKGTLARLEINVSVVIVALLLVAVGYGVVSALADRLDPEVRGCVARSLQAATDAGRPQARETAVKLCKHLEEIGALQ